MVVFGLFRNSIDYLLDFIRKKFEPSNEIDSDVIMNIIIFYEDVIDLEPNKTQLYLPLAVIYYEDLGDKILAREYFEKFIEIYKSNNDKEIKILLDEAGKYLKK